MDYQLVFEEFGKMYYETKTHFYHIQKCCQEYVYFSISNKQVRTETEEIKHDLLLLFLSFFPQTQFNHVLINLNVKRQY